jgi:Rieske Fe-S protein
MAAKAQRAAARPRGAGEMHVCRPRRVERSKVKLWERRIFVTLSEEKKASRRKFFANGLKAVTALFGLGLGIPLTGFFISPAIKKEERDWIGVAALSQLRDNEPTRITYQHTRKDGWVQSQTRKSIFIIKLEDGKIAALSNRCTHLGCGVDWNARSGSFTCPCHGGIFNAQGIPVEGPPSKPLIQLLTKVEANTIFIKEA